jgi:hypothetical protein
MYRHSGGNVRIDKNEVVGLLRARGDHDKAANVDCALPQQVDTEQDAGVLHTFDVNVRDLTSASESETPSGSDPDRAGRV